MCKAFLAQECKLTLRKIGKLTPRHIVEIYMRDRSKDKPTVKEDGGPKPGTEEFEVEQAREMALALDPPADPRVPMELARKRWRKKHRRSSP